MMSSHWVAAAGLALEDHWANFLLLLGAAPYQRIKAPLKDLEKQKFCLFFSCTHALYAGVKNLSVVL